VPRVYPVLPFERSLIVAFVIAAQRKATENFSGVPAMTCKQRSRIKADFKPAAAKRDCI